MSRARLLAFYLPQFHPIPENDVWWGPGFTEWTNVVKARPLFRGHYQPRLPADLGFYDLRIPEVREAQAELARQAGIEGFVYYHYWFAGKRLLDRPFSEVVTSGRPKLPFGICWANQTWSGIWHGAPNRVLIEQTYPGDADYEQHFLALLDAFSDERYIRVDRKPIFIVYRPLELSDPLRFIELWRNLAAKNGLRGLHFVAHLLPPELDWDYRVRGFDAALVTNTFKAFNIPRRVIARRRMAKPGWGLRQGRLAKYLAHHASLPLRQLLGGFGNVVLYEDAMLFFADWNGDPDFYPSAIPNWDNTPRSGSRGVVLHESTPELFGTHLRAVIASVADRAPDRQLVFIKSWNEWAEGNYLEPDQKFGRRYLEVVRDVVMADHQGTVAL
jgi:lipopolysaccharide biosynthesis protein